MIEETEFNNGKQTISFKCFDLIFFCLCFSLFSSSAYTILYWLIAATTYYEFQVEISAVTN